MVNIIEMSEQVEAYDLIMNYSGERGREKLTYITLLLFY